LNERRVAIVPATVQTLVKKGFAVNVEEGAGLESSFANKEYEEAGAKVTNAANVYKSNIILKVLFVDLLFDLFLCNSKPGRCAAGNYFSSASTFSSTDGYI